MEARWQDVVHDQLVGLCRGELYVSTGFFIKALQDALPYRMRRREKPESDQPLRLLPVGAGGFLASELSFEQLARGAVLLLELPFQPRDPLPSVAELVEPVDGLPAEEESRVLAIPGDTQEPRGHLSLLGGWLVEVTGSFKTNSSLGKLSHGAGVFRRDGCTRDQEIHAIPIDVQPGKPPIVDPGSQPLG